MKKLIFTLCLAAASGSVWANDAAVALVKRMYQEARTDKPGVDIVEKYADASLKKAFRIAGNSGMACPEEDPMWGNQDPQAQAKVTVVAAGGNKVKASFKQYGQSISRVYSVNCSGGSCKVADVSGLKNEMLQCR